MSLWLDSKYEFMDSLKRGKSEEEQNMSYEPNKEFWVWVVGEIEFWDMSFEWWILSNELAPIQTNSYFHGYIQYGLSLISRPNVIL